MADKESTSFIKVTPFDGRRENYPTWASSVRAALIGAGVWSAVDEVKPPQERKDLMEKWEPKNGKAYAIIYLNLSDVVKARYEDVVHARRLWEDIKETYAKVNAVQLVHILADFWGKKKGEDQSIQSYLNDKHTLHQRLNKQQQKIPEFHLIATIIANLDTKWKSVGSNILARIDPESGDIAAVESELYQAEEYDDTLKAKEASSETAAFTSGQKGKKKKKNKNKQQAGSDGEECTHCGKTGHIPDNCWEEHPEKAPEWYRSQQGGATSSSNGSNSKGKNKGKGKAQGKQDEIDEESTMLTFSAAMLTAALLTKGALVPGVCPDTGATSHYFNDKRMFTEMTACRIPISTSEEGRKIYATGQGPAILRSRGELFKIGHALYVPELSTPLLSLSTLQQRGHSFKSSSSGLEIQLNDGRKIKCLLSTRGGLGGLYYIPVDDYPLSAEQRAASFLTGSTEEKTAIWHERLGHPGQTVMRQAAQTYNLDLSREVKCDTCELAKSHVQPASRRTKDSIATVPLGRVHSDIMGPIAPTTFGGSKYIVTFIDDFTSKVWVMPMTHKSQTFPIFKAFQAVVEREIGHKIKILRSDNGGEYISTEFNQHCTTNGIKRELTSPYSPLQNGKAERMNRSLQEMVRTFILNRKIDPRLWADLFITAAYVKNVLPSAAVANKGKSPDELWFGKLTPIGHLRAIGCRAFVHMPKGQEQTKHLRQGKLGPRARIGQLVGYCDTKTYRVHMGDGQIATTRDVTFDESQSGLTSSGTESQQQVQGGEVTAAGSGGGGGVTLPDISSFVRPEPSDSIDVTSRIEGSRASATPPPRYASEEPNSPQSSAPQIPETIPETVDEGEEADRDSGEAENTDDEVERSLTPVSPLRARPLLSEDNVSDSDSSRRSRTSTSRLGIDVPMNNSLGTLLTVDDGPEVAFLTPIRDGDEPNSYNEAMKSPYKREWKEAIQRELNSMHKNKVWKLVDRPPDANIVSNRWVFKVKRDTEGKIVKYKARLVVRGFSQIEGKDYKETFAPVSRMTTFRLLIAKATQHGLHLRHLDIETAFLYGKCDTDIYMEQPEGAHDGSSKVAQLVMALYGLRQAPMIWHQTLATVLESMGFKTVDGDVCLFEKGKDSNYCAMLVYVDDFIVAATSLKCIAEVIATLRKRFVVKDLGQPTHYLGIQIHYDREKGSAVINQKRYLEAILERFNMSYCNPTTTPMRTSQLHDDDGQLIDTVPYRQAVGSLQYAATCTRLDLAYPTRVMASYNNAVTRARWAVVKEILRFVKGTIDHAIQYNRTSPAAFQINVFSDANWNRTGDCLSTTGYVAVLNGGAISWASKKQKKVATSTQHAELNAAYSACKEIVWIRRFDLSLGSRPPVGPLTLFVDNQTAIHWIAGKTHHEAGKHYEIDLTYIRQVVKDSLVKIEFERTQAQPADILTKVLPSPGMERCKKLLGYVRSS